MKTRCKRVIKKSKYRYLANLRSGLVASPLAFFLLYNYTLFFLEKNKGVFCNKHSQEDIRIVKEKGDKNSYKVGIKEKQEIIRGLSFVFLL